MRDVIFIGRAGCGACLDLLGKVVMPLWERYPENVSVHVAGWDSAMERVNRRKAITRVPLFVVERDGEEEFRFSGRLGLDELEEIVLCDSETLALDDVLGVV